MTISEYASDVLRGPITPVNCLKCTTVLQSCWRVRKRRGQHSRPPCRGCKATVLLRPGNVQVTNGAFWILLVHSLHSVSQAMALPSLATALRAVRPRTPVVPPLVANNLHQAALPKINNRCACSLAVHWRARFVRQAPPQKTKTSAATSRSVPSSVSSCTKHGTTGGGCTVTLKRTSPNGTVFSSNPKPSKRKAAPRK